MVVRGNSLLQHYQLNVVDKAGHADGQDMAEIAFETVRSVSQLVLVAEFPLDGHVVALRKFRRPDFDHDLLIVAFKYAKMVFLSWNEATLLFDPVSMHYYEKDLHQDHFFNPDFEPKLTVDPGFHSLSLLFQRDRLAMLAFPFTAEYDDVAQDLTFFPSMLLSAVDLDTSCTNIIDLAYRHGYAEPTLSVLFAPKRTWTGTLGLVDDNVTYMVFSVDMQRRCSTVLAKETGLPYDITRIIPLDAPIGGTLLLGANSIIYVDTSQKMGTNEYSKFDNTLDVDLVGAQVCQLDGTPHVVVATQAGQLYDLAFRTQGKRRMTMSEITDAPKCFQPTTLSCLGSHLFVGCKGSNARLFSWTAASQNGVAAASQSETSDEIDELHASIAHKEDFGGELTLLISDELVSTGPMGPLTSLGDAITVATGSGSDGGFTNFVKTVWPLHRDRRSLGRPRKIWGLGSYLLASFENESRLFRGLDFDPVDGGDFLLEFPTLGAIMTSEGKVFHVHTQGIVVYDAQFSKVAETAFENEALEACVSAEVIVVLFDGVVRAYGPDLSEKSASQGQDAIGIFGDKMMSSQAGHVMIDSTDFYFGSLNRVVGECSEAVLSDEPITQVVAAKLGDNVSLANVLAVVIDDILTVYEPRGDTFVKVFATTVAVDSQVVPLEVGNFSVLFLTGRYPQILIKSASSPIRCHPFGRRRVVSVSTLDTDIVYTDNKYRVNLVGLDDAFDYTTSEWPHQKIKLGEPVSALAFDRASQLLVIGTNKFTDRDALLDNGQPVPGTLTDAKFKGQTLTGTLKLVSPDTGAVYDTFELPEFESVMSMDVVTLQMGEASELFEDFLAVGTSILLDEDAVSNGHFILFSIKEVHTESKGYRLEKVSEELVRGAVSAVCEVEGGGAVSGQGQKLIMRRYRDVYAIEPVAFFDADVFVEDVKSVRNLIAVGDAVRGVSLLSAGYEPYRMDLVAKDYDTELKVSALDFISSDERDDLFIAIADNFGRLRLDQFDPETPSSMGGSRLVTQSEIYTGRQINSMTLVYGEGQSLVPVCGSTEGALVAVEPLNETDYKALYIVTEQMADKEQNTACLNPRTHRAFNCQPTPQAVIDFGLARKFLMLTRERQLHYSRKLGQHGLVQVFDALTRRGFDY